MQHFPFIFNGTPCRTAPTVVDTSGDNFGHRLLPAPEVEPSLVFFGHHSLHHAVAASDLTPTRAQQTTQLDVTQGVRLGPVN